MAEGGQCCCMLGEEREKEEVDKKNIAPEKTENHAEKQSGEDHRKQLMELKTFGKLQHLRGIKYKKVMVIYKNRNFRREGIAAQNLEKSQKISRHDLSMNKERHVKDPMQHISLLGRPFMDS